VLKGRVVTPIGCLTGQRRFEPAFLSADRRARSIRSTSLGEAL
jgi:hypothetical protein